MEPTEGEAILANEARERIEALRPRLKVLEDHMTKDRSGLSVFRDALGLAAASRFVRESAGWSLSLFSVFVIIDRVLWVSHGNTDTATSIVAAGNKSTVLFGIAVQTFPSISGGLFGAVLFIFINRSSARVRVWIFYKCSGLPIPKDELYDPTAAWLLVALIFLLFVTLVMLPWSVWLGEVGFLVVLVIGQFFSLRSWHRNCTVMFLSLPGSDEEIKAIQQFTKINDLNLVALLVFLTAAIISIFFVATVWLPSTRYVLLNGKKIIGYTLAESTSRTTILIDSSRVVITEPDQMIVSAEECQLAVPPTSMAEKFHLLSKSDEPSCFNDPVKRASTRKTFWILPQSHVASRAHLQNSVSNATGLADCAETVMYPIPIICATHGRYRTSVN